MCAENLVGPAIIFSFDDTFKVWAGGHYVVTEEKKSYSFQTVVKVTGTVIYEPFCLL